MVIDCDVIRTMTKTFHSHFRDIHQNNSIVNDLFNDSSSVLLRFQKPNGSQPYTVIKQLPKFSYIPISVQQVTGFAIFLV